MSETAGMPEAKAPDANEKKILSALGLCARARALISGVPMICEALGKGNAKGAKKPLIVLEASDTSENTHKRITDKCRYYGVRYYRLSCTGDTLAHAIGKSGVIGAVATTDTQLSRAVENILPTSEPKMP